jgi:hypothetical protein
MLTAGDFGPGHLLLRWLRTPSKNHNLLKSPNFNFRSASQVASFEAWSDIVRSALMWLGKADPVQSMMVARNEDPEQMRLLNLLTAWVADVGFTKEIALSRLISDYFEPMDGPYHGANFPELHDALFAIAGKQSGGSEKIDVIRLGNWLRRLKGRIVGGLRFNNKTPSGHPARWWVEHQDGQAGQRRYAEQAAKDEAQTNEADQTAPFSRPGGDG